MKMTGNTQSNSNSNFEIAQSNQELIMTKDRRKKRRWMIAGVVGVIAVALVVAAILLMWTGTKHVVAPQDQMGVDNEKTEAEALSLEDVLYGRVNPRTFNATWVSGKELLYTDINGNLVLQDLELETNSTKTLLAFSESILLRAYEFSLSADKKYLLVSHNYQKIYRHSYQAKYTIIDLETDERTDLSVSGNLDLLLVVWSPVGNALAFVYKNNIYYKTSVTSEVTIQITRDNNFVYNGIPDWVYEEEVFSSNKALWFSPDGKKIAYARFDDANTPIMVIPIYGEPGNLQFQYPRAQVIRYPKAGTANPLVSLHCVDLENTTTIQQLGPPTDLVKKEPILTAVAWANNKVLTAIWMNRVQNEASIVTYLTIEPYTTEIVKHLNQTEGWLELFSPPLFSEDGTKLALILSQKQENDLGAYRHLVLLSRQQDSPVEPLTKGAFVVTELLAWNNDNNNIYYLANTEEDSAVQHLYSVSVDSGNVNCLSCGRKSKNQKLDCLYNSVEFSKDSSHYVLTCAGPDVPDLSIYSISKKVLEWEENEELQELVKGKRVPKVVRKTFDVGGGFKAQVSLKLPPNMDTSGYTKYPMLVNVYAGPDSFQVIEKFNLDWGSYLAANKSIIYATIDGRGSGLKGDKMLFASYRRLGSVEIIDQINVTRQIQESLPYVDNSRTGIWGWSYGGYAAGMILADDSEGIFKCGISVAPVTDWALYDSIYTERFMGLPTDSDNLEGYQNSSLLFKYEGLRDKEYFLIHGTYDDNVHYQQSMLWSKVLEQNDILFRQLSYPDEDHGLASVRPHLYHSLENFLDECFITEGSH